MAEKEKGDFDAFDRWLVLLAVTPPAIWLTHLSVSYSFVPQACEWTDKTVLHVLTMVALAITVLCSWLSWRALARLGTAGPTSQPHEPRRRFMAVTAVVFGVLFTMLTVANEIPNLILRSCD